MNLKVYAALFAASVAAFYVYGAYQYRQGYSAAEAHQRQQAQQQLAKQTATVQAAETKAAAADVEGKEKAEVIYRDVIKYVKTPGRTVCTFDDIRMQLKSRAVDNANNISGFDDTAVQTRNTGR